MTHPLFDLSGRVALVTGAAQGMGRATAIALAEAGADVLITDINAEGLQATTKHIGALGRRAVPVPGDITSVDFVRSMYAQLDREFGRIDVAANIAGPARGNFPYSVGMGGVAQMTRELSTEWSGRGVRVNAILPAQVMNPGLKERMASDPNLEATFLRGIPIGRFGQPDDIKGLAIFLASDASSWITGAIIPMDGGNLAMNAGGTAGGKG